MSLSVNYVPAKFTRMHAQGEGAGAGAIGGNMGLRKRRKVGGGREAFADGAHRMGQMGMVDDDDGVEYKMARGGVRRKAGKARRLRWNRFKAILFAANTVVSQYCIPSTLDVIESDFVDYAIWSSDASSCYPRLAECVLLCGCYSSRK